MIPGHPIVSRILPADGVSGKEIQEWPWHGGSRFRAEREKPKWFYGKPGHKRYFQHLFALKQTADDFLCFFHRRC